MSTLFRHARLATMAGSQPWGWIDDGALWVVDHQIAWVGDDSAIPATLTPDREIDLHRALLTPGLIDCHTHLVYAGNRANEFELRLLGASYETIARRGGGIRSTVAATREASDDALFLSAAKRARGLMREGVTTIEIKSGYGLTEVHEARCLAAARRLAQELPVSVRTTSLAAHALPDEFADNAEGYIDAACTWLTRQHAAGLVDAVDVFCDRIGFNTAQTRRVFDRARQLSLPVKLHAEQLSNQHGAALAAEYGALSCDHLEHLDDAGIKAMRAAGTVAVMLPGAFFHLRETKLPPIDGLRSAGVPMAIATDHNPGSSPTLSLLLMLNMACTLFRLTPEEAFSGVTTNAARALGLQDRGQLRVGQRADLAVFDVDHPRELAYQLGVNPCTQRMHGGVLDGARPA